MVGAGQGLTGLSTDELQKLLRHLHRGELVCPVDIHRLTVVGFQYKAHALTSALRGLDEQGVRAVLVCVLAERLAP